MPCHCRSTVVNLTNFIMFSMLENIFWQNFFSGRTRQNTIQETSFLNYAGQTYFAAYGLIKTSY